MKIEIDELRQFMEDVAAKYGEITAFGFFLRDDATGQDKWDLVVSAPWLTRGRLQMLRELGAEVSATFRGEKLLSISHIVVLKDGDPALDAMVRMGDPDKTVEFRDSDEYGPRIRHGYILRAKRPERETADAV